ncbi:MAG TPA: metallophosphoesterase family protein [Acidobacteriota bacterium]|nr:metallophosphoesterase family protein [Acidobacteriota bacterium]
MKTLILSDIHSNLEALDAALQQSSFQEVWVLGDLVGYGADPEAVVKRVRELQPAHIVRGNHDKVCCGLEDVSRFSDLARDAALWTRGQIGRETRDYLLDLPQGPKRVEGWTLSHGSPWDEDEYLLDQEQVWPQMDSLRDPVCLFGHTHVPMLYRSRGGRRQAFHITDSCTVQIQDDERYFINPGSVGQPRDGDSRGCFGLLDREEKTLRFIKFEYDIEAAAQKILKAGLPSLLASRLQVGR